MGREYRDPDNPNVFYKPEDLEELPREDQKSVMRHWFDAIYVDPVHNSPYVDGEYMYIYGGPYDAQEELDEEFSDCVEQEIIDELAEALSYECMLWTRYDDEDESYRDYLYESISKSSEHHHKFLSAVEQSTSLITLVLSERQEQLVLRLVYANIITATEVYLSDSFISKVASDSNVFAKFVESNPDFRERKILFSEFIKFKDKFEKEVYDYLLDVVWHNLGKVRQMYKATLSCDFPADISELSKAVIVRHDLVHRNGLSKDGVEHSVTKEDVQKLADIARSFVAHIDQRINP